jgi:hypothetical protein
MFASMKIDDRRNSNGKVLGKIEDKRMMLNLRKNATKTFNSKKT